MEEELRKAITTWEDENEDVFLINGERYLNLIQAQQENRKRVKKMLKLGKVNYKGKLYPKYSLHPSQCDERRDWKLRHSLSANSTLYQLSCKVISAGYDDTEYL